MMVEETSLELLVPPRWERTVAWTKVLTVKTQKIMDIVGRDLGG